MSNLTSSEKLIIENLLDMGGGYVLDFSNSTFSDFFKSINNINIDDEKYCKNGTSKANRLRSFISIEDDRVVGFALNQLLERWQTIKDINGLIATQPEQNLFDRGKQIANRLLNQIVEDNNTNEIEDIGEIDFEILNIEPSLLKIIKQRTTEIAKCLKIGSPLAAILLCGSTLEGLLLDNATKHIIQFNQAKTTPRDNFGNPKHLNEWTLHNLICVSCEVLDLGEDVKKFSSSLRDFRNYIHPKEQLKSNFQPDIHTADICFRVLKLAIIRLSPEYSQGGFSEKHI